MMLTTSYVGKLASKEALGVLEPSYGLHFSCRVVEFRFSHNGVRGKPEASVIRRG